MSEAQEILARAREREARREAAYVPIDYAAAAQEFRRQKAALTRAVNSGDRDKVIVACRDAVREWDQPGRAWPDDWSRWQRALDDCFPVFHAPRLEDLR
jgi:hypothetical protein